MLRDIYVKINKMIGSIITIDGRTFIILKDLTRYYRTREIFIIKGKKTNELKMGEFYNLNKLSPNLT